MNTALKILKALQERNKTVSELAKEIGLSKATVFYHVQRLCKAELTKRIENGNKFVYYSLTEKGRRLIKIFCSIATSIIISYILAVISNKKGEYYSIGYSEYLPSSFSYLSMETNFYMAFILAFVFIFTIIYTSWTLLEKV